MMKKAFAAMALAAMTMSAHAGLVINEGFDNVAGLASSGWVLTSNSTPGGSTTAWFQGTPSVFDAQSGDATSYIASNYNSAPENGTIENWLVTPEFDATNGANIYFYLRAGGEGYADQLAYGFTAAGAAAMTTITAVPDGDWTLYNVYLAANTLGTTRFAFEYFGDANASNFVGIDSVTVDLPEPASLALVAGGLLGLGALRRRTRR